MKKGFIIIFCLFISSLTFASLKGKGYGDTEKTAKKSALEELSNSISVDVTSQFYNVQSVVNDEYYKNSQQQTNITSNLKLIGVQYNATKQGSQYEVEAYLDSSSIPAYLREVDQTYELINTNYARSKSMDNSNRIESLKNISNMIDEFYNYQTVLSLLGENITKKLDLTKSDVEYEINTLEKLINQKKNLFIDNFIGYSEEDSVKSIQNEISSWVIDSNRFNVVTLKKSADLILSGKMVNFIVNEIDELRDRKTGDIIEYAAFGTSMQMEVSFYDREKGVYSISKTVTGSGFHSGSLYEQPNRSKAIQYAKEDLINKLTFSIDQEFVIEGKINKVDQNKFVEINKGSNVGVKKHMDFFVYAPNDKVKQNKIAGLRITDVNKEKSVGQIFEVFDLNTVVDEGFQISEAKEEVQIQGRIIKKKNSKVFINLGKNMNINKGDVYYVYDDKKGEIITDSETGFVLSERRKKKGKIVITEIQDKYAIAKVVRGNFAVEQNMFAKESTERNLRFRLELKRSFQNVTVQQNKEYLYLNGNGYYGNKGADNFQNDLIGRQWKLGLSMHALSWPVSFESEFSNIEVDEDLKGLELTIGGRYNVNLIGRTLVAYLGGNFGFAGVTQTDAREITNPLSPSTATKVEKALAQSFSSAAKLGLEINYKGLIIGTEAGYKKLKFDDFNSYDTNLEKTKDLDEDGLKYTKLDMTGAYYQLTLGFEF